MGDCWHSDWDDLASLEIAAVAEAASVSDAFVHLLLQQRVKVGHSRIGTLGHGVESDQDKLWHA